MKFRIKIYLGLLFVIAGSSRSYGQIKELFGITFPKVYTIVKPGGPPAVKDEWKLVFEDNFDGTKPDETKWQLHPKWGNVFAIGDKNRRDSVTNGGSELCAPENILISNGTAKLFTKKEERVANALNYVPATDTLADGITCKRTFNYTAGCFISKQLFGPGKYEIRCKIPNIDGVWPAFWLYGRCGQELDVFEFLNERYSSPTDKSNKSLHMTYHRKLKCEEEKTYAHGTTLVDTIDYSKDFHTYSIEWDQYQITWRVDGKIKKVVYGLKRLHSKRPVDEKKIKKKRKYRLYQVMPDESIPMDLIVSCGVTNYGNPKDPINRGEYPKTFEVDYVRAWVKEKNK